MADLTHFDASGQAHMVDVSDKAVTDRVAVAEGWVRMRPETLALVEAGTAKKGDVLGIARLAGIMGTKQTATLIPLCHPLPITKVAVDLDCDADLPGVRIRATVKTTGQTGVEMEALTAVSTAALTVYDMLKAAEKSMEIGGLRVVLKDGGKSGRYEA
jgi:cyclic pyranopterin phosphate synthase